jgi:hypothetical protein
MRPFRESSDVLGEPEGLRRRMAEDGYLYLRGLLPRRAVLEVRRQMLAIADEAGWLRRDRPRDEAIAEPASFTVEPEPQFMAVYYRENALRSLNALQQHPSLLGLFERLLGDEVFAHPRFIIRNIFPKRQAYTTPAHQDFIHFQGTPDCYAAWIPIGDCPAEMGGLLVVEGSHREGLYDVEPALGAGALETVGDFEGRWRWNPFEAGDVLIHNSHTVHKGVPNRSDSLRLSIDARYQRVRDPVCEDSLHPHRRFATWDELYRDWPADDLLRFYWRRLALKPVAFDFGFYEKRDRRAFELAEGGDLRARSTLQRIVSNDPAPAKREKARDLLARLEAVNPA